MRGTLNLKPGTLWLAAGLAVVWLAGSGCTQRPFGKSKEDPAPDAAAMAVPVEVAAIRRGAIEAVQKTSRHLEAEQEVRVYARTANRVTKLLVEEGDRVEQGQVLVQLEDDIQTTQAEKARGNVERARREFARLEALYAQRLISEQVYSDSQFELRQLELALEDAQRQLDYTRVVAPIAGTVTLRLVKEGDLVNVSQHLFDLVDFNSIVARVYLPESELPNLRVGQPVRVVATALPGQEHEGYVQRIAPVVERKTGTVKVTVAFRDVGALRPGMYVTVELVTASNAQALLIPKRALVHDGGQIFAYRLGEERVVQRVLVRPRLGDELHVEPLEGFAEGDLLVVAGQTGLRDGARVRLPGDPDPADAAAAAKPVVASSSPKTKS